MKNILVKGISKPWFDSNIMKAVQVRGKVKEKCLRIKLHVVHKHFKEQRNLVQKKIKNKKLNFVRSPLEKSTNKSK